MTAFVGVLLCLAIMPCFSPGAGVVLLRGSVGAVARRDVESHGGVVRPARRLAGGRADHRLRRRHRRAVPLRDHAARRRPTTIPSVSPPVPAAARRSGSAWSSCGGDLPGATSTPTSDQPLGGTVRTTATSRPIALVLFTPWAPSRRPPCCSGARGRRQRGAGPERRARAQAARAPDEGPEDRSGRPSATVVSGEHYLVLAALLFTIGAVGLLVRRNVLVMFMCVELMLNAVNLTFVRVRPRAQRRRRPGDRVLHAGGRRRRGGRRPRDHRRDLPAPGSASTPTRSTC